MMVYKQLESVLLQVRAESVAAESHGNLCGLLCANRQANEYTWLASILGEIQPAQIEALDIAARRCLLEVYHETVERIGDMELSFDLLLPDDEQALVERVAALGAWCAGFIYGLGVGGLGDWRRLPTQAAEIVQDIVDISHVDKVAAPDETGEKDYFQLREYVRMGVVFIYETLQTPENSSPVTLH